MGVFVNSFQQGGLDSLCGVYSIINADRIINKTNYEMSKNFFDEVIDFLSEEDLLVSMLKEGMFSKHIKKVIEEVVPMKLDRPFYGKSTPSLDEFWGVVFDFLNDANDRAIILSLSGKHDHWSVTNKISDKRIFLCDSAGLEFLDRTRCTTSELEGKIKHKIHPAQTYFLSRQG